jgi:hypothetical protein
LRPVIGQSSGQTPQIVTAAKATTGGRVIASPTKLSYVELDDVAHGAAHEVVADVIFRARSAAQSDTGIVMAKKVKKRVRREYTRADVKELRAHSKAKTPVAKIAKQMKRSEASLRQKALTLGIGLGHRR